MAIRDERRSTAARPAASVGVDAGGARDLIAASEARAEQRRLRDEGDANPLWEASAGRHVVSPALPLSARAASIIADVNRSELLVLVLEARDRADERIRAAGEVRRWHSVAWDFVYWIRFKEPFKDLSAKVAAELVEWAAAKILDTDVEFLWMELLGDSDSLGGGSDPYSDFRQCWDKLRGPDGLAALLDGIRADPPTDGEFGPDASGARNAAYRQFLALVQRLVNLQDGQLVFLAVKPIGSLFDVTPSTVSNWRVRAVDDGFLKLVSEGKRGRAAEYEWLGRSSQGAE